MRELFLVISVMGAGYCSVQTSHQFVHRFLEHPGMEDVTADMPIDPIDDLRSIKRADLLVHSRKSNIPIQPRPFCRVEKEWIFSCWNPETEQLAFASFTRKAASNSSNDYSDQEPQAVR